MIIFTLPRNFAQSNGNHYGKNALQFPTDVQVNNGTGKMSIGKVKRKGLDEQTTSERSLMNLYSENQLYYSHRKKHVQCVSDRF